MTTLHEEQTVLPRKHSLDLLSHHTIEEQCEDGQEQKQEMAINSKVTSKDRRNIPTSRTLDSLVELAPKVGSPSTTSSGYGSQTVSQTNLSTDDSMSMRSISVDETPDFEGKQNSNDLKPVSEVLNNKQVGLTTENTFYLLYLILTIYHFERCGKMVFS